MTPSQLMQALSEAGAPFEAILIAVKALDEKDAEIAARDAEKAEKRARDAERKRQSRASVKRPRKVRGRSKDCPADPPKDNIQTPGSGISPSGENQNAVCVRDADWPEIPNWVDPVAWNGFHEMRRKKRAWATARAVDLLLADLTKWRAKGHDPTLILNTSTKSNWTDLYEPKATANDRQHSHSAKPTTRQIGERVAAGFASGSDRDSHLLPGPRAACGHDG